jgi:hypothetical protein
MSRIKAVQKGDKLSFESYGETIAVKNNKVWVPTKLITPELAKQLKERIKNDG